MIGSKWVFKVKTDNTYKARLVAQGWNQVLVETAVEPILLFAGFKASGWSLRSAAELNLEVSQLDGKTVFLYADIEEEVCTLRRQPGFCDEAGK